ncbi:MAG: hypothetical protein OJF50_006455 [Nitrospira sp.]|nr:hypothetical protein [Nitrospira sp.]
MAGSRLSIGPLIAAAGVLLTGCAETLFVPMELAPYRVHQTQTDLRPTGEPRLHVQTHPDGLGWTLSLSQQFQQSTTKEEQEVWAGYVHGRSPDLGRQVTLTLGTGLGCPASLVAHVMSWGWSLFGLLDKPPTWRLFYQFCLVPLQGLDPAQKSWTTQPQGSSDVATFMTVIDRPVTTGRVQLRWIPSASDPIGIEYPLDGPFVDIRLRDLAQLLQRNRQPPHLRTGRLQLAWYGTGGDTVTEDLSATPHTLDAALQSDLVRRPQADWPPVIRLRLASNDPAIGRLAEQTATQLRIPVVTRTEGLAALQDLQRREVSPLHADAAGSAIGHWVGATVLLRLQVTADARRHRHVHAMAIGVEQGTILGQFTMEGPHGMSADFEGLIRAELEALLQPSFRHQGLLIDEGGRR